MEIEVIKLGGSLLEYPDLFPKLKSFLHSLGAGTFVIVTGGGKLVRNLELNNSCTTSSLEHWESIQIMTKNARWLSRFVPSTIMTGIAPPETSGSHILDAYSFCRSDMDNNNQFRLPENRGTRSDSIALRYAIASNARNLWLIKSCDKANDTDWNHAADLGLVDSYFPSMIMKKPNRLGVKWVNLLTWPSL